ncbi:MAG: hypothetical protein NUW37_02350 [Planctomycetes bacterium]|nr:hypothetical protein [Planctomycetota bacterium]
MTNKVLLAAILMFAMILYAPPASAQDEVSPGFFLEKNKVLIIKRNNRYSGMMIRSIYIRENDTDRERFGDSIYFEWWYRPSEGGLLYGPGVLSGVNYVELKESRGLLIFGNVVLQIKDVSADKVLIAFKPDNFELVQGDDPGPPMYFANSGEDTNVGIDAIEGGYQFFSEPSPDEAILNLENEGRIATLPVDSPPFGSFTREPYEFVDLRFSAEQPSGKPIPPNPNGTHFYVKLRKNESPVANILMRFVVATDENYYRTDYLSSNEQGKFMVSVPPGEYVLVTYEIDNPSISALSGCYFPREIVRNEFSAGITGIPTPEIITVTISGEPREVTLDLYDAITLQSPKSRSVIQGIGVNPQDENDPGLSIPPQAVFAGSAHPCGKTYKLRIGRAISSLSEIVYEDARLVEASPINIVSVSMHFERTEEGDESVESKFPDAGWYWWEMLVYDAAGNLTSRSTERWLFKIE